MRRLNPLYWPVALRVPLFVVVLMLVVSGVITNSVFTRLIDTQNRHLAELSGAYLDGLSSALLPHVLRDDVWEVYDVLDRSRQRYQGLEIAWTTVTDMSSVVIASSEPNLHALQSRLPDALAAQFPSGNGVVSDANAGISRLRRILTHQGRPIGAIYTETRISSLIAERWDVLATLVATNLVLTLVLAGIGYAAVRRMLRPVRILADHMRAGAAGAVAPIPVHELGVPASEFGQLFRRYNSLLSTVAERERLLSRLAEEERLAAVGRLASGMAHEINNPLGGMLNAVDALRRHGDRPGVRETSLRLLEHGLTGIRDVVRSALATYRQKRKDRPLSVADIDDLALLVQPEIKRKQIELAWHNELGTGTPVPVVAIRDVALNLLLNACAAAPVGGQVSFSIRCESGEIVMRVEDNGPGLPHDAVTYLNTPDPPVAPADTRSGLGLWMVRRVVHEAGGTVRAERRQEGGARVTLRIPSLRPGEIRNVA